MRGSWLGGSAGDSSVAAGRGAAGAAPSPPYDETEIETDGAASASAVPAGVAGDGAVAASAPPGTAESGAWVSVAAGSSAVAPVASVAGSGDDSVGFFGRRENNAIVRA